MLNSVNKSVMSTGTGTVHHPLNASFVYPVKSLLTCQLALPLQNIRATWMVLTPAALRAKVQAMMLTSGTLRRSHCPKICM